MNNNRIVVNWHVSIINDCEKILGRRLQEVEALLITSRGGLVALEMIHDHVKSLSKEPDQLGRYLNSEAPGPRNATKPGALK